MWAATLWSIAVKWAGRVVGLFSTLVLVRLLTPEDFGVMALAMLVIGLSEVLLDLGTANWLIQKKDASTEDYDLAWTVRLLQLMAVGTLIALAAPYAGKYFGDARIVDVLYVISFFTAVGGLESIGPVAWQKALDFRASFILTVTRRVIAAVATIAVAAGHGNYWALAVGMAANTITGVILSYLMCPYRPHWNLRGWEPLLRASKWMLLSSISGYLSNRVDIFLLGRAGGSNQVGVYSVSQEMASLPTSDLLAPMSRALFPGFVRDRDDYRALSRLYLLASGVQATLAIPMSIGIYLVADMLVPLVLGEKWLVAVPVVGLLAISSGIVSLSYSSAYLLYSCANFRFVGVVSACSLIWFVVSGLMMFGFGDSREVAYVRCLTSMFSSIALICGAVRLTNVASIWRVLGTFVRPLAASCVMLIVVMGVQQYGSFAGYLRLSVSVLAGIVSYVVGLLVCWHTVGRPEGPERYLLAKLGYSPEN